MDIRKIYFNDKNKEAIDTTMKEFKDEDELRKWLEKQAQIENVQLKRGTVNICAHKMHEVPEGTVDADGFEAEWWIDDKYYLEEFDNCIDYEVKKGAGK